MRYRVNKILLAGLILAFAHMIFISSIDCQAATKSTKKAASKLTASQIEQMDADAIANITLKQMSKLTATELLAFSPEQRALLSPEQMAKINPKEWDAAVEMRAKAFNSSLGNNSQAIATGTNTTAVQENTKQAALASIPAANVAFGRYHKVNVLGDSIVYGVGASDSAHTVTAQISQLMGIPVNNYGTSCSRITDIVSDISNPGSFVDRMYGMDKSADLVVISGGTNDFWYGDCPIGKPTDSSPNTFYGAMNTMFNYVKGAFPNSTIVFVVPHQQSKGATMTSGPNRTTYSNFGTGTLNHYRKAMLDRCQAHNIPVLDMYSDPNFNLCDDKEALLKYGSSVADGCHLNDAGYRYVATKLVNFVSAYDPSTYVPAVSYYNDMIFATAALPHMLGPAGFVMPNGSVLPYNPAAVPTAKSSVKACYNAFIAAAY